jgi:hypothetical protein
VLNVLLLVTAKVFLTSTLVNLDVSNQAVLNPVLPEEAKMPILIIGNPF